jgi:hypothetical protein
MHEAKVAHEVEAASHLAAFRANVSHPEAWQEDAPSLVVSALLLLFPYCARRAAAGALDDPSVAAYVPVR